MICLTPPWIYYWYTVSINIKDFSALVKKQLTDWLIYQHRTIKSHGLMIWTMELHTSDVWVHIPLTLWQPDRWRCPPPQTSSPVPGNRTDLPGSLYWYPAQTEDTGEQKHENITMEITVVMSGCSLIVTWFLHKPITDSNPIQNRTVQGKHDESLCSIMWYHKKHVFDTCAYKMDGHMYLRIGSPTVNYIKKNIGTSLLLGCSRNAYSFFFFFYLIIYFYIV